MKKMKKIASLMLALVMTLAMTIPVFADTVGSDAPGKGSITIANASKGAKYTLYKIFDATYADANGTTVAYTYNGNGWTENEYFTFDNNSKAVTATAKAFADETIPTDLTSAKLSTEAKAFLKGLAEESTPIHSNIEATDGKALVFKGLDYGYYLVTSTLNDGTEIAINSTTPDATMYDKNVTEPNWDDNNGKKIISINGTGIESTTSTSAAFGDEITFQLTVKTQNYAEVEKEDGTKEYKQIQNYLIKDEYRPTAFGDVNISKVEVIHKETGKDDEITSVDDYTCDPEENINGEFTITVPWVDGNGASKYESNDLLVITYTAKLLDTAEIAGEGNVNKAALGWNYGPNGPGPDPEGGEGSKTTTATVYTYALAIKKVDPKGTALQGAVFNIKKGSDALKADGSTGTYNYSSNATNADFTSDNDGLIIIKGVADGTYTVTEKTAPSGYNKWTGNKDIKAELNSVKNYTSTITYKTDAEGNIIEGTEDGTESTFSTNDVKVTGIVIVNHAGSLLPSTGGIGTTLFYIIGGILVVGAAVLLVTKKRMSREA